MSGNSSLLQSVTLYGVEHSPWVLGISLALMHHKIAVRMTSYPLSLSWLWNNGPVFPALRLNDGQTYVDSFSMYELLEQNGYPMGLNSLSQEQRLLLQVELEELFSNYAVGRVSRGKKWRFLIGWSTSRGPR